MAAEEEVVEVEEVEVCKHHKMYLVVYCTRDAMQLVSLQDVEKLFSVLSHITDIINNNVTLLVLSSDLPMYV